MQVKNNTILVTGGGSGIGFQTAKLLSEQGNQVIITGRNAEKLQKAAAQLSNVTAIACDITSEADVDKLVSELKTSFPNLNILINNAGLAYVYDISGQTDGFAKAQAEMLTNYLAIIRLTEKLLPSFNLQPEAAVVNVSSIAALVPGASLATYSASKAALHSYTQSLRVQLQKNNAPTKVFELMPPLVNTDFSAEIGGINGIPPLQVAENLLDALKNDTFEIHVGQTADMYQLHLSSPADALQLMNSSI